MANQGHCATKLFRRQVLFSISTNVFSPSLPRSYQTRTRTKRLVATGSEKERFNRSSRPQMKVAFLIERFDPARGGMETSAKEFLSEVVPLDVEAHVVTQSAGGDFPFLKVHALGA